MAEVSTDMLNLVTLAAQELGNEVLFVGIGVPSLAAITAKRTHAPDATLIYESGAIDAVPPAPPLSTGSPCVLENTFMATSCLGVFSLLQQGYFDIGMLSAAQVDRQGNLNSTVLGPYDRPKVRLVGSGGAHDIAVLAKKLLIMMPHDPRRFVEKVDFITSPGLGARGGEGNMYDRRGQGPYCVITPRARFSFEAGELTLDGVIDGYTEADALEGFAWEVPRAANVKKFTPPSEALQKEASRIIALDPAG
jgi:glutaconate CoA-transferase, subunit B